MPHQKAFLRLVSRGKALSDKVIKKLAGITEERPFIHHASYKSQMDAREISNV